MRWSASDKPPQSLGLGWAWAALMAVGFLAWIVHRAAAPAIASLIAQGWPALATRVASQAGVLAAWIAASAAVVSIPEAATLCLRRHGGEGFFRGWARGALGWPRAWLALALAGALGALGIFWALHSVATSRQPRQGSGKSLLHWWSAPARWALGGLLELWEKGAAWTLDMWRPIRRDFLLRQGLGAQWLAWRREVDGGVAESAADPFDWPARGQFNPFWAPWGWEPRPQPKARGGEAFSPEYFVEEVLWRRAASGRSLGVAGFFAASERVRAHAKRIVERGELHEAVSQGGYGSRAAAATGPEVRGQSRPDAQSAPARKTRRL